MSHLDPKKALRLVDEDCRLLLVQDQLQPCPYLDGVTARMPLRLPVGPVKPSVTDQLLAMGYRRSGDFVYNTACPACSECQPTRIELDRFRHSASMRRVMKRGNRDLVCEWGKPRVDAKRVWLFNQHRRQRGLCQGADDVDLEGYRMFLADSCCDTQELAIWLDEELVAVSIVDAGAMSFSAVYTHFDPHAMRYSLGTYALLRQIEHGIETGRKYLYLGMYVAENRHLNYKARFQPQQRLIDGQWCEITN
jgi:arginine-tRNA-protein transferase